jgi:hypothetical protein
LIEHPPNGFGRDRKNTEKTIVFKKFMQARRSKIRMANLRHDAERRVRMADRRGIGATPNEAIPFQDAAALSELLLGSKIGAD